LPLNWSKLELLEKNGPERKKMNGKGKKWSGTGKNEPDQKKMNRTGVNNLPGTFSFLFFLSFHSIVGA
jgi:hypothetical protein